MHFSSISQRLLPSLLKKVDSWASIKCSLISILTVWPPPPTVTEYLGTNCYIIYIPHVILEM